MELSQEIVDFRSVGALPCHGAGSLEIGTDERTGASVAVRVLTASPSAEEAIDLVRELPPHPTLPVIHRAQERGPAGPHFVMDYPRGPLLSALMEPPCTPEFVLRVWVDLADALAVLHLHGMIHGALRPESVRIASGRAILWDAGIVIAERIAKEPSPTLAPQYRAPELTPGSPPTAAQDVYALAAIVCHASGALVGRDEIPWTFSEPLRRLLSRMLSPEAAERPSALAIIEALEQQGIRPTFAQDALPAEGAQGGADDELLMLSPSEVIEVPVTAESGIEYDDERSASPGGPDPSVLALAAHFGAKSQGGTRFGRLKALAGSIFGPRESREGDPKNDPEPDSPGPRSSMNGAN